MEKRAYERITTSLEVRFFYGIQLCSGIVTNCSENGMCINSSMCLPFDTRIELLIPFKEDVLKVPVKVKRLEKTDVAYEKMGVELLYSLPKYLELVNILKPTL